MNIKIESFIEAANKFYENCKDNNSNLQWEHCYKVFYEARKQHKPDIDFLSLHLSFYLASWGMYRGKAFIRDYDYRVHIPVVEEILKEEYDILLGIECDKYDTDELVTLMNLKNAIRAKYNSIQKKLRTSPMSKTLITKILLGTLGCVPAYDTYFEAAIKECGFKNYSCNKRSIEELKTFYADNSEEFEKHRKMVILHDTAI